MLSLSLRRRQSKWPALAAAVDEKIEDQAAFVAWWDEKVRGAGNPSIAADRGQLARDDVEASTGISNQQVSRWRKALQDRDKYREKIVTGGASAIKQQQRSASHDRKTYADSPTRYHQSLTRASPLSGAAGREPRHVRRDLGGRLADEGCQAAMEEAGRLGARVAGKSCEEAYEKIKELGDDQDDDDD